MTNPSNAVDSHLDKTEARPVDNVMQQVGRQPTFGVPWTPQLFQQRQETLQRKGGVSVNSKQIEACKTRQAITRWIELAEGRALGFISHCKEDVGKPFS